MTNRDVSFVGAIPDIYDRLMVPLLFQPFAEDLAARVSARQPASVLETAAGTGVVTRALAPQLGKGARYVVTDLNAPMLEKARAQQPEDGRLEWATADALDLPFEDHTFDALCCQFGVMFFPDRARGYAEARRVLKPGAPFIFSVWDRLAENAAFNAIGGVVLARYPDQPIDFIQRVPYGYFDQQRIREDLRAGGFTDVTIETVTRKGKAQSPRDAAMAVVQGSPVRMEILARNEADLEAVTEEAEAAVRKAFGEGPFTAQIQALVVTASA